MKIEVAQHIFVKFSSIKYNQNWYPFSRCFVRMDRRTDGAILIAVPQGCQHT
jgi:hypothetical protein